jgi:ribosomal protein S12 methylthiotransferase
LKARIPGVVIRTSVITGLPGEGEEEFAQLCEFLKEQRLVRTGAFVFSPEEGTPAADMDRVDTDIAADRAEMIQELQAQIMEEYNASMIGKTMEVLVDGYDEEAEQFFGRTYADSPEIDGRVWLASEEALCEGSFVQVCIDGLADGDLSGYVLEDEV